MRNDRPYSTYQNGSRLFVSITAYSLLGLAQRSVWVLMIPVYLATLPPNQFGILVLITLIANVSAVIANLKLDAAVRTFYFDFVDDDSGRKKYLQRILTASLIAAATLYFLICIVGEIIFRWLFDHPELRFFPLAPVAIATAFVSACITPYLVYLRNESRLKELATLQLAWVAGSITMQLLFIVQFELAVLGAFLGAFVPAALALVYVFSRTKFAALRSIYTNIRESLLYSAPLMIFAFFFMLESRLDILVLEHHVDLDKLGGYAMLVSVVGLLSFALNSLDNALRPMLYPALQGDAPADVLRYKNIYTRFGLSALSFAVLVGSLIGFVTDEPDYLEAQRWLVFAAMALLPMIFTRFYALYFDFHKRSAELAYWMMFRTLFMLALLLVMVPAYGIAGAIAAVLVSQLVNCIAFSLSARRKFSITTPIYSTLLQVAAIVIIIGLLYFWIRPVSMPLFGGLQFLLVVSVLSAWYRFSGPGGTHEYS